MDTTGSLSDWGAEATSWGEKSVNEERVIVDKTDQDSWPTVGGRGKGNTEQAVPGNIDTHSRKENWRSDVTTFGDSLDAAIDGMEAAEEAAGSWDSAKWSGSEGSLKDSGSNNSGDTKDLLDTKGNSQQSWSKTPGKGVKLKGSTANNKTENSSDSLSSSLDEGNSGGKESGSFDDEWKTVGKSSTKGTKNDPSPGPSPSEETGWGESSVGNRNSGSNWSASWSSQGLSLTGTEIWDEGNGEDKKNLNNDKGSDWLENSGDSKSAGDGGWEDVGGDDGGGDGWNRWTMASSKRNKVTLDGVEVHVNRVHCRSGIDLFHKWRLLHGNEARMLFSQSILVSNYQTDMISFLAFLLLSIRVRFRIWIILLFSDFSKDKTEKHVSLVVGNKY